MNSPATRPLLLAVACSLWLGAAGCAVPVTTASLSGAALGGGALVAISEVNDAGLESASHYRYTYRAEMEEVVWVLQRMVRTRNEAALFAEAEGGSDASRLSPRKLRTPVPFFEIDRELSRSTSDSLVYVISYRRGRKVAFVVTPARLGTVVVNIAPYEPKSGALLMLAADDSQRGAVEAVHESFYMTVRDLLGHYRLLSDDRPARLQPPQADPVPVPDSEAVTASGVPVPDPPKAAR